jgi:hypothetical protein
MASNRAILKEKRPQIATQGHYGDLEVIRVDVTARTATFQAKNTNYEETVPVSTIRPLTEEDSGKFWEALVADLMRVLRIEAHYPPFVKGFEVETGEDSTGDPPFILRSSSPRSRSTHRQPSPAGIASRTSFWTDC